MIWFWSLYFIVGMFLYYVYASLGVEYFVRDDKEIMEDQEYLDFMNSLAGKAIMFIVLLLFGAPTAIYFIIKYGGKNNGSH